MQLQGATAVRVRRHDPSQCAPARIVCVVCLFLVFAPRHQEIKVTLREMRQRGQSSVARRRCAERSELLYPFRCNVVTVGAGGGTLRCLVLQRNEARALREHGHGLQLLWRAGLDEVQKSLLECIFRGVLSEVHRPLRRSSGKSRY